MANTAKQNFRYPGEQWDKAVTKTVHMRQAGWPIDMTKWLSRAVDDLLAMTPEQIAERMGIEKEPEPARILRRPYERNTL